jgi:hypothetical protein
MSHVACCLLHVACYIAGHAACCMLSVACCMLHCRTCCMLHVTLQDMLHVACYLAVHVACCMLPCSTCCMLHVTLQDMLRVACYIAGHVACCRIPSAKLHFVTEGSSMARGLHARLVRCNVHQRAANSTVQHTMCDHSPCNMRDSVADGDSYRRTGH